MTGAWFPSANPGGNDRKLVRWALADWIDAQRIDGIDHVYRSKPTVWQFDLYPHTGTDFSCLIAATLGLDSEDRLAVTGPIDPGGKLVHYNAALLINHRSVVPDDSQESSDSEDDYDRIVGALKDCLRGNGRDLGRPEVILQIGEYPRVGGIRHKPDPPIQDGDTTVRTGRIDFQITQYLVKYPQ